MQFSSLFCEIVRFVRYFQVNLTCSLIEISPSLRFHFWHCSEPSGCGVRINNHFTRCDCQTDQILCEFVRLITAHPDRMLNNSKVGWATTNSQHWCVNRIMNENLKLDKNKKNSIEIPKNTPSNNNIKPPKNKTNQKLSKAKNTNHDRIQ